LAHVVVDRIGGHELIVGFVFPFASIPRLHGCSDDCANTAPATPGKIDQSAAACLSTPLGES
jgi:hypothetical protein